MKKTYIMALAAALVATVAFADRTLEQLVQAQKEMSQNEWKMSLTVNEWKVLADDYIARYSKDKHARPVGNCIYKIMDEYSLVPNANAIASEYDSKLAALGVKLTPHVYSKAPLCSELWLNDPTNATWVALHPLKVALMRERKTAYLSLYKKNVTVPEYANLVAEEAANPSKFVDHKFTNLDTTKKFILSGISSVVRKRLRSLGKPIVVQPDGTNPVQDEINKLTIALDSPKFAGLKEWMAEYYPDYKWVDVAWKSDEAFAEYKEAVYIGDKPFDSSAMFMLPIYLGVTEYNKFVKEYNK